MSRPLRVLFVEDVPTDTQLLLRLLRKNDFVPQALRVETAEELLRALEAQEWDIIVTDYGLPQFSGPAVLDILRQRGCDTPCIVVTGTMGEDVAVEMMRAGAADFIVKSSLARLVPAIEREMREAEVRAQKRHTEQTLRESEERLRWQAYHDALTGLPNRRLFHDRVEEAIALPRHGKLLAIVFLDLDGFKHINDTFGHPVGDVLLRAAAGRLATAMRVQDTIARMGGDEFTVLLPDLESMDSVVPIVQRLLHTFAEPFEVSGHELFISASIGISFHGADGEDEPTLLRHADMAMYRAKQQGRGGYQLYADGMHETVSERLMLENSLRRALTRDELALFYQPLVDGADGTIRGVEALVRWYHPELGLVSPVKFISLAEETGLIAPLGRWVLREACRQAAAWEREGRPLRVSVNLSARQFGASCVAEVEEALEESGLSPQWLGLEITESAMMQNKDVSIGIMSALQSRGVLFSVDDFGTGYSSLSYLRYFPFDVLKVDSSFVHRLVHDHQDYAQDYAIVRAVIELAHALKMSVVAEGVETEEQREKLLSLNCDIMQGYLFCPPEPLGRLELYWNRAVKEASERRRAA